MVGEISTTKDLLVVRQEGKDSLNSIIWMPLFLSVIECKAIQQLVLDSGLHSSYATSVDYDPTQEVRIAFETAQKIHWAITGQTAAA